jgi:hypothetical protein
MKGPTILEWIGIVFGLAVWLALTFPLAASYESIHGPPIWGAMLFASVPVLVGGYLIYLAIRYNRFRIAGMAIGIAAITIIVLAMKSIVAGWR